MYGFCLERLHEGFNIVVMANTKTLKTVTILVLLMFMVPVHAQDFYTGTLLDAKTGEALAYVNIGVLDRGIGTVSNEEGKFQLKISKEIQGTDILQFSSVGYETIRIPVKDLVLDDSVFPVITMKQKIELLQEVVLSDKGVLESVREQVGYETKSQRNFGYWNEDIALGAELATKIYVKKGNRRLRRFSMTTVANKADSVLVRLNFYDEAAGLPNHKLVQQNILVTLKDIGVRNVDLTPYNIEVKDDFIVSLELLQVYGDTVDLVLLASNREGTSYKRYASQGKWEPIGEVAMAYVLDTDYYTLAKGRYRKKSKGERTQRLITGYVFRQGLSVPNITVINETTNETVLTDTKGIYSITAEHNDVIRFTISEEEIKRITVDDKDIVHMVF